MRIAKSYDNDSNESERRSRSESGFGSRPLTTSASAVDDGALELLKTITAAQFAAMPLAEKRGFLSKLPKGKQMQEPERAKLWLLYTEGKGSEYEQLGELLFFVRFGFPIDVAMRSDVEEATIKATQEQPAGYAAIPKTRDAASRYSGLAHSDAVNSERSNLLALLRKRSKVTAIEQASKRIADLSNSDAVLAEVETHSASRTAHQQRAQQHFDEATASRANQSRSADDMQDLSRIWLELERLPDTMVEELGNIAAFSTKPAGYVLAEDQSAGFIGGVFYDNTKSIEIDVGKDGFRPKARQEADVFVDLEHVVRHEIGHAVLDARPELQHGLGQLIEVIGEPKSQVKRLNSLLGTTATELTIDALCDALPLANFGNAFAATKSTLRTRDDRQIFYNGEYKAIYIYGKDAETAVAETSNYAAFSEHEFFAECFAFWFGPAPRPALPSPVAALMTQADGPVMSLDELVEKGLIPKQDRWKYEKDPK